MTKWIKSVLEKNLLLSLPQGRKLYNVVHKNIFQDTDGVVSSSESTSAKRSRNRVMHRKLSSTVFNALENIDFLKLNGKTDVEIADQFAWGNDVADVYGILLLTETE